jgi:pyruvate kinase
MGIMIAKRSRHREDVRELADAIDALRTDVVAEGSKTYLRWRPRLTRRAFRASALNLAAYLALRRRDLRALQASLMPFGLSSLGRCESRVVASLDAVGAALGRIVGSDDARRFPSTERFFAGERRLRENTAALLTTGVHPRSVGIMITPSSDAATDAVLIDRLVQGGMDVARINAARRCGAR